MFDDKDLFLDPQKMPIINHWIEFFTREFNGFYRPVGFSFLYFEYIFFGTNSWPYHAVNFVLLFIICRLFYSLLILWGCSAKLAFFTVCLYAAHPFQNMLFNYKTASVLSMYVIFSQLALIFYAINLQHKGKKYIFYYGLSFGSFVLSILSHIVAVLIPVYLHLYEFFIKRRPFKETMRRLWVYYAMAAGIFHLRDVMEGVRPITTIATYYFTLLSYFNSLCQLLSWYLVKLFVPTDTLFLWNVLINEENVLQHILILIAIVSLICFIFKPWRHRRYLFLTLLFVVSLPVLFVGTFIYSYNSTALIEPHWFYVPSIGLFAMITKKLLDLKIKSYLPVLGVFVLWVALTMVNNQYWKSEIDYAQYWVEKNQYNEVPYTTLNSQILEGYANIEDKSQLTCEDWSNVKSVYKFFEQEHFIVMIDDMMNRIGIQCSG